jgi:hypothetical protein
MAHQSQKKLEKDINNLKIDMYEVKDKVTKQGIEMAKIDNNRERIE